MREIFRAWRTSRCAKSCGERGGRGRPPRTKSRLSEADLRPAATEEPTRRCALGGLPSFCRILFGDRVFNKGFALLFSGAYVHDTVIRCGALPALLVGIACD
jgi:hypothetical protein